MKTRISGPFHPVRQDDYPVELRAQVLDYVREHCTVQQVFNRCSGALAKAIPSLWEGDTNLVDDAVMQTATLDPLLRVIPVSITDAFLGDYLSYTRQHLTVIPVSGGWLQHQLGGMA